MESEDLRQQLYNKNDQLSHQMGLLRETRQELQFVTEDRDLYKVQQTKLKKNLQKAKEKDESSSL